MIITIDAIRTAYWCLMPRPKHVLDERRLAFCRAVVDGMQKQGAAIHAGYSPRTAGQIASQLLRQKVIKDEIARLRAERDARVEADDERKLKDSYESSLELFRDVYNNPKLPFSVRVAAAKEALPYEHGKVGPKGKKEQKREDALSAAAGKGKFDVPTRPKLRAVS